MHQTLIFGQDVANLKDARRVREPWKIRFASRLAEFSGLQINDILFPLSFDLGEIWIFWRYFYCRWLENQKMESALMPIEGLFLLLASIRAHADNCEKNTQKWNSNNKDSKKETIKTLMWLSRGDLVVWRFVNQNVLQRRVSKLLNEPPYGRQNQTNRRDMFRKTSAMKSFD